MEQNDWLDERLYEIMPVLDRKLLTDPGAQAEQDDHLFSRNFERKMRRLIHRTAVVDCGYDNVSGCDNASWKKVFFHLPIKRKCAAILIVVLMTLTATAALADTIQKIVQKNYWYDAEQGADFYEYHSDGEETAENFSFVYPSYIPAGYKLEDENRREEQGILRLTYVDENEDEIWYQMYMLGSMTIAFDAEYDSSEELVINEVSWFVTYREGSYWMARGQRGDILAVLNTRDTLPREEIMRILEGIEIPERNAVSMRRKNEKTQDINDSVNTFVNDPVGSDYYCLQQR